MMEIAVWKFALLVGWAVVSAAIIAVQGLSLKDVNDRREMEREWENEQRLLVLASDYADRQIRAELEGLVEEYGLKKKEHGPQKKVKK